MKHFNLSGWAVSHPALILFLVVALGAAGFFSYERLGRAEDPFFTVKVVNVSAIWPGATAAEMQTQVADPIEKKLQELPYFEKVQTYSKPSFTAMQVTFKDSTPPKDVPYLFYLLRKKLVDVQGELPSGLLGPVVNDEFSDVDSILYMMTGDGADSAQLKQAAEGRGQVFRRGDIATVTHGCVDPPSFVVRQEGKPAIGIGVVTAKGANILELGKDVAGASAEFMKAVPQGINVELIAHQPKVVKQAVSEFVDSFVEALAIVLFVSFLALGWRTGFVVAASVPLVLAIVFIVMNAMSLDLHRITLGALIIALGLMVDDAIIAVEMMG